MWKRKLSMLLVAILFLGVIAACSTGNNNNNNNSNINNNNNNNVAANNDEEEQIDYANMEAEVTFSTIFSDNEFDTMIGDYVRAKFPKYTINHISNRTHTVDELVVGGIDFDIYFGRANGIVNTYEPLQLTKDMTALAEKHGVDLNAFAPGYVESGTFDGKLYALPIFNDSLVLYYNKDMFDRFGVDYPRDGMTWDEILDLASEFDRNEDGVQYMGLWMSPKHYFRMNSLSQGFIDPNTNKVTVDNENWKRVFEIFEGLSRDSGVQEMAKENFPGHDHFRGGNQQVAMYVFITEWIAVSDVQLARVNWDMVSMPVFKDHPTLGTQTYANYAGITSISKNEDAAMQVLKYLTSEEYQMEISKRGKITPLLSEKVRDVAFEEHPDQDKNFGAVFVNENAPMREMHELETIVVDIMNEKIQDLIKGEKDINTVLREAQDAAQLAVDQELLRQ